jgi:hypothetical protein
MQNRQRARLQLEPLEPRNLCAGNVTAAVTEGNLTISGDALANCLSVESAGEGRIQVRGFETRVNGVLNATRVFSGVTGGVFIRTSGGNDLVRVTNVILPGKLVIDLGWGDDEAVTGHDKPLGDARFADTPTGHLATYGDVRIFGRKGNDLLYQSYFHAKKPATIDMGEGNDTVRMRRYPGENRDMQYRGATSIAMGLGQDIVDIDGLLAQSSLTVTDDSGQLQLTVRRTTVEGACFVGLGTGWDRVDLSGVQARSLTIRGGAGNDLLSIKNTTAVDAVFAGDADTDTYRDSISLPNRFTTLNRTSFEKIEHVA